MFSITVSAPSKNIKLNFSAGSTGATIDYTGAGVTASGQTKGS